MQDGHNEFDIFNNYNTTNKFTRIYSSLDVVNYCNFDSGYYSNMSRKNYINNWKNKKKIFNNFGLSARVLLISIILIGLRLTEPLELFNDVNIKEKYVQKISRANPNEKYEIVFDIDSKVAYNKERHM